VLRDAALGAAAKVFDSEPFKSQMRDIAMLADRQQAIGSKISAELAASTLRPEPIDVIMPPPNPMPGLLRDLVEVNQEQTAQIQALVQSTTAAVAEEHARAEAAVTRETKMYRVTLVSLAIAFLSFIVAIIALAA
jgi:DnaJ-domain-containing protein 1